MAKNPDRPNRPLRRDPAETDWSAPDIPGGCRPSSLKPEAAAQAELSRLALELYSDRFPCGGPTDALTQAHTDFM